MVLEMGTKVKPEVESRIRTGTIGSIGIRYWMECENVKRIRN